VETTVRRQVPSFAATPLMGHPLCEAMMTIAEPLTLTARWRVLYTMALVLGLLTAGFGSEGWLGLATGSMPSRFAIPGVVLLLLGLGRLIWVWCRPQVLTWPATDELRALGKVSLVVSLAGIVGVLASIGSGLLIKTLATDVRGAASLVIGLFLLPLVALPSLCLVAFEWVRGWTARMTVPAEDRALLTTTAIVGAVLAIAPVVSRALFPLHSLTRSQYNGVLPWVMFALGLGALVVRGLRGSKFPASAVFSTTLAAYVVVALVPTALSSPKGFGIALLVHAKGMLVAGAGFALVLAVVPAGALAILDRLGTHRSGSWVMRAFIATPLVLAVAWLGISTGTKALQSPPRHMREGVLSAEQLSRQAEHLRQRCPQAGTQILGTASDVAELEIRFPDELRGTRQEVKRILPDMTRPHRWFPMERRMPVYNPIVFVKDGKRIGYGLDATQSHGYGRVEAKDIYPRYVLTWRSLQTPEEEADGVVGNEMTITDRQNNAVLARRVLFFNRTNERYGSFQEGCGTLGQKVIPDDYPYQWAKTVLFPKSRPSGAPQESTLTN
jgi:hypothetical protein